MLLGAAITVIVLWLIGTITSFPMNVFYNMLFLGAIGVVLIRLVNGRNPV